MERTSVRIPNIFFLAHTFALRLAKKRKCLFEYLDIVTSRPASLGLFARTYFLLIFFCLRLSICCCIPDFENERSLVLSSHRLADASNCWRPYLSLYFSKEFIN